MCVGRGGLEERDGGVTLRNWEREVGRSVCVGGGGEGITPGVAYRDYGLKVRMFIV